MQSRLESGVESLLNIAVGMAVAFVSQLVVFPLVGVPEQELSTHLQITVWFTLISLVPSYVIRRWFNGLSLRKGS